MEIEHDMEGHYAIPWDWDSPPGWERELPEVEVRGTSLREPECDDNWCALADAVQWEGPAELDYVITSGGGEDGTEMVKYHLWEERDEF